jgi:hypothetical protein
MTADNFNAWGWRIFFIIGFVVAIVGLIIRMRTMDSAVTKAEHEAEADHVGDRRQDDVAGTHQIKIRNGAPIRTSAVT